MILVWSRKAIAESSRTRRSLHSLPLPRDLQQFLFFVNHGYAHISLLCFPLVMFSASHWLLAQARFCERTHLPLSPNSTTPTVQVSYRYLRPDAPVFNIHSIHSNCGHGDISAIALLMLSLSGCSYFNILWYTAPVEMMTFRWSHRSYQSICQQHLPYSHLQVTLIYYTGSVPLTTANVANWILIEDIDQQFESFHVLFSVLPFDMSNLLMIKCYPFFYFED